ncbi:hypothetical protein V6N11_030535 [Hibiscus sabdariffa]
MVPIVGEPAGNETIPGEDSLAVQLTDGNEPLHEEHGGSDVLLAGSLPSTADRADCHVELPSVHNGSGDEVHSVNDSLGTRVELPESLEHSGGSSGASGTIEDLVSEGCIILGEVVVETPDEAVATDSL